MSRAINNIYTILNNPFKLMELITYFYSSYENQDKDILLSYLIFPLILNRDSRKKLLNLNRNCNLLSLTKNSNSVVGLEQMIEEYKDITNECIQIALLNGYLELNENKSLVRTNKVLKNEFFKFSEEYTAIRNFAVILKSNDIVTIYRMLGVKKI